MILIITQEMAKKRGTVLGNCHISDQTAFSKVWGLGEHKKGRVRNLFQCTFLKTMTFLMTLEFKDEKMHEMFIEYLY